MGPRDSAKAHRYLRRRACAFLCTAVKASTSSGRSFYFYFMSYCMFPGLGTHNEGKPVPLECCELSSTTSTGDSTWATSVEPFLNSNLNLNYWERQLLTSRSTFRVSAVESGHSFASDGFLGAASPEWVPRIGRQQKGNRTYTLLFISAQPHLDAQAHQDHKVTWSSLSAPEGSSTSVTSSNVSSSIARCIIRQGSAKHQKPNRRPCGTCQHDKKKVAWVNALFIFFVYADIAFSASFQKEQAAVKDVRGPDSPAFRTYCLKMPGKKFMVEFVAQRYRLNFVTLWNA